MSLVCCLVRLSRQRDTDESCLSSSNEGTVILHFSFKRDMQFDFW